MTKQPPPPPPPERQKKRWHQKTWVRVVGALVVLSIIFGRGGDEEPPPEPDDEVVAQEEGDEPEPEEAINEVEVPDLTGPYADALDLADEADIELRSVDEVGDYQSIWDRNNWEVESQSVDAGERVEPGTEITVTVYRPSDREREQERAERAEAEAQEQAQREAERATWGAEEFFADRVGNRDYSWHSEGEGEGDSILFVEFEAADALFMGMTRRGLESDMAAAYTFAFHEPGTDAELVFVTATFPLIDQFGNTSQGRVLATELDRETAERINWSDPHAIRWEHVWTENFRHHELEDDD